MKYRIVEREYPHSGEVEYVVERSFDDQDIWTSVFTSPELEKVKEVYTERLNKSMYVDKVITV